MADMHGITVPQAVEILRKMKIDKFVITDMDEVYSNMALDAAIQVLSLADKLNNFQWEVRKKLEGYKKQQNANEVLSDNGRWLATSVIKQCLKILDNCILEARGLTAEDGANPNDIDEENEYFN